MLKLATVPFILALGACPPTQSLPETAPSAPPAVVTPPPPPPPSAPPEAAADPHAQAEQVFTQRCSVCHGMSGKGDGPGSVALNPKPRNYTDAAWQTSVTDDYIAKVIVEGGAANGKSPLMAPNADLKDKPDVVKELVKKVRSFKGK